MKKPLYPVIVLLLIALSFLAGNWSNRTPATVSASGGRKILYYHDPMHPAYKSDKPGIAPDCGMQLEPVYADGGSGGPGPSESLPPGTLSVSLEKQQLIGVRTVAVRNSEGTSTIRILGRVAADDTRVYPIRAAVDGWIREVFNNSVGSLVKKGESLASFYSPDFLTAEQNYVFTVNNMTRVRPPVQESLSQFQLPDSRLQVYLDALHNLGMGDAQIETLKKKREFIENVVISAPETGFVTVRNVAPELRFQKGAELYRIADLRRVWILADLFENEADHLRPGLTATVSYPQGGRSFSARVSDILPEFDPASRTLKVRLEADNPGYALRPDMFVDVEIHVSRPPMLTVPADAVLETGLRKTVFVDLGNGHFEPRRVETGERFQGHVEIVKGLSVGEKVVVSGNFLLDSESRLKAAAEGPRPETVDDPACGMKVNPEKAGDRKSIYEGITYYFCSDVCKKNFDANPGSFVAKRKENDETRQTAAVASR